MEIGRSRHYTGGELSRLEVQLDRVKAWEVLKDFSLARVDLMWLKGADRLIENNLIESIPQILKEEAVAFHRYTDGSFAFNGHLNNGNTLTALELMWQSLLRNGINKLQGTSKQYIGLLYRGQSLPEDLILQKYVLPFQQAQAMGGPAYVTENAFISTTKSQAIADDFIQNSMNWGGTDPTKRPVMFHIDSKTGVDIDNISYYGANFCNANPRCDVIQEEILMIDGLTFRIQNVEITDGGGFNVYEVFLEEF